MAKPNPAEPNLCETEASKDCQKDGDKYENATLQVEDEVRRDKVAGEDTQDEEAFDTYEFGGQEEEQSVPEASTSQSLPDLSQLAGQWAGGLNVCTAHINTQRKYVCVEFPAIIKNKDRAFKMLGGKEVVEKFLSRQGRLELSFRPEDPYCKPAVSSERSCGNLLVKIRRRRAPDLSASSDGFQYQIEVLGVVESIYEFDKPCDFQYLPVVKTESGHKEILSTIKPSIDDDREEYLKRQCPLFLPPTMFSRRERPCSHSLEDDPLELKPDRQPDSLRKKRVHGSYIINFDCEDTPTEPMNIAKANIKRYCPTYCIDEAVASLKKLFEERPVWSKVACVAHLEPQYERQLKYLLPLVSYCFITGPWRNLWCVFGYDPRKNKESKKYQVIDFRVRSTYFREKVVRKRHLDTARTYQNHIHRSTETETSLEKDIDDSKSQYDKDSFDPKYMFRPDTVPPYRQMRYQLCDILEEQVQKKIHENDGKETECTERDGWCVPDMSDVTRDILNVHVERLLGT